MANWVETFAEELRARARQMREYFDERGAAITDKHADEFEARWVAYGDEEISIDVGAQESGYHPEALRKLKSEGKWSGRRADLPRRPGAASPGPQLLVSGSEPSLAESILSGQHGGEPRRRRATR